MKKKLIIRADASIEIGTGHIMRCIALAQGWQDRGGEVLFISHCESDTLRERILKEGFRFISLNRTCPDVSDLEDTLDIIEGEKNGQRDWVVLDGYHFTSEYQQAVRDRGHPLLVIDDMNHLPFYHADILLNQNLHALDLKYCSDSDTTLLLGSRYVLLRREFLEYRKCRRRIPDKARKILVTMGGSDPGNVTLMVIDALRNLNDSEIEIKVVIGPANPHRETLSKALTGANFPEELIVNPSNMPELMNGGYGHHAGGSTCWELAFMGVPIMALILADNQEALAEGISKRGFGVNLGSNKTLNKKKITREINTLLQSKHRRSAMVKTGFKLINAEFNDNLYKRMLALPISIEPVQKGDCEMIWKWANDKMCAISFSFSFDFVRRS
jgi:UDP-2,4-diacetamido-2,4,6-trideoxy-beta-L-altropyranose hydrolase